MPVRRALRGTVLDRGSIARPVNTRPLKMGILYIVQQDHCSRRQLVAQWSALYPHLGHVLGTIPAGARFKRRIFRLRS